VREKKPKSVGRQRDGTEPIGRTHLLAVYYVDFELGRILMSRPAFTPGVHPAQLADEWPALHYQSLSDLQKALLERGSALFWKLRAVRDGFRPGPVDFLCVVRVYVRTSGGGEALEERMSDVLLALVENRATTADGSTDRLALGCNWHLSVVEREELTDDPLLLDIEDVKSSRIATTAELRMPAVGDPAPPVSSPAGSPARADLLRSLMEDVQSEFRAAPEQRESLLKGPLRDIMLACTGLLGVAQQGEGAAARAATQLLSELSVALATQQGVTPSRSGPALTIEDLRAKMRRAKDRSGLTLQQIGVAMGYEPKTARVCVSNLLVEKTDNPGIMTVQRFAAAVGIDLVSMLRPSHPTENPHATS
jgi:hypothetical protein